MGEVAQSGSGAPPAFPVVRAATFEDVRAALSQGWQDFASAPAYGLFFGGIYALGGLLVVSTVAFMGMSYLAYPLAAGFVLIGPFVAAGLYEVSRRLEKNEPLDWRGVIGVVFAQGGREFAWMAFVSIFAFIVWMYQVRLLLALFLGFQSFASFGAFMHVLVTTGDGLAFLALGHIVGAVMASLVFSLTAISFPLLLDRDVDFITAMIVSVQAVIKSPVVMLGWAFAIVVIIALASAPFFLGLFVALPVLGHATWRLYRRIVAPV
jgi:uncharacterized membrane protein